MQIAFEGACAVMTGEDTDGKATQFRRRTKHSRASSAAFIRIMRASQTSGRRNPDGETRIQKEMTEPPAQFHAFVVGEQWLCFLLGLICLICGVCGLFMKYNEDSLFAFLRWLGPAYGPTLRFIALACFVLGAVLVRLGLARPDRISISSARKVLRFARGRRVPDPNAVPVQRTSLDNEWKLRGKTNMKDDPDDIPMVYLLYVVLAIAVLVAGAAIVVTRML